MNDKDFSFPTDAKRVVPSADDAAPEADAPPRQDAKKPDAGEREVKAPRARRAQHAACDCQTNWRMAWVLLLAYLMSMVTILVIVHRSTAAMQESQTRSTDTIKAAVENLGATFTAAIRDIVKSNQDVIASTQRNTDAINGSAEGQAKIYAALLEANRRPNDRVVAQPAHAKLTRAEKDRVTAMLNKVQGRRSEVEEIRAMLRRNADREDIIASLDRLSSKLRGKSKDDAKRVTTTLKNPPQPRLQQGVTAE